MTSAGKTVSSWFSEPVIQAGSPEHIKSLSWSPDGRKLAVVKMVEGKANIYVLTLRNLEWQQVSSFPYEYSDSEYRLMSPSWSPDGTRIAFSYTPNYHFGDLDYRIWLVHLEDFTINSVSSGRIDDHPAWISNDIILFTKGTHSSPNIPEIYRVDLLENEETAITSDQSTYKYAPDVDSEHDLIAYSGRALGDHASTLFSLPLKGGDSKQLTAGDYWSDLHPAWSPDGDEIYFTSDRRGHFEVWRMDAASGDVAQVTRGLENTNSFYGRAWPDGDNIAVIEVVSGNGRVLKIQDR
jgi:Tol biopolymer transport system component